MYSVFNGYNITTVQLIIYLSGEKKKFQFQKACHCEDCKPHFHPSNLNLYKKPNAVKIASCVQSIKII